MQFSCKWFTCSIFLAQRHRNRRSACPGGPAARNICLTYWLATTNSAGRLVKSAVWHRLPLSVWFVQYCCTAPSRTQDVLPVCLLTSKALPMLSRYKVAQIYCLLHCRSDMALSQGPWQQMWYTLTETTLNMFETCWMINSRIAKRL